MTTVPTFSEGVAVEKAATLHPSTVTEVSQGQHLRRKPRKPKSVVDPITHIRVDPQVWKVAMRLADGDPHRLVVHDATNVSVCNRRVR